MIFRRAVEKMRDDLLERNKEMEQISSTAANAYIKELMRNCPKGHLLVLGIANMFTAGHCIDRWETFYSDFYGTPWSDCIEKVKKEANLNTEFQYIQPEKLCVLNPELYTADISEEQAHPWIVLEYGEYIKKWEYVVPYAKEQK